MNDGKAVNNTKHIIQNLIPNNKIKIRQNKISNKATQITVCFLHKFKLSHFSNDANI